MDKVDVALKITNYSEIARKSGTTPGFISMLFRGHRRPKMETARKVAKAMGVSLDELDGHLSKLAEPKNKYPNWQKLKRTRATSKAPVVSAA